MQSLSISQISQKRSPSITGYLFIKRNLFWNQRYVRMSDGKLSYYEQKTDTTPKAVLNLKNAQVVQKYGGKDNVILVKVMYGPIPELMIKIEKPMFKTKFMRCLYQNIKGEEKNGKEGKDFEFDGLEDPTVNDYPALPDQYKSYYNKRLELVSSDGGELVFHEVSTKKKDNKSRSNGEVVGARKTRIQETFLIGLALGGLLVSSLNTFPPLYIGIALFIFSTLIFILSKRKTSPSSSQTDFIRKQHIIHTQLDQIFSILQNMRPQLYLKDDVKFIFNQQLYFQQDNKYQLIEKDINRLRYLWEFIPADGKTLVSVVYSADNPEISLKLLEHLSYKIKTVDLGERGIKKSRISLVGSSQIRSKSVLPIVPISSMKEVEVELEDDGKENSFLPSSAEMKVLYPKTPEVLIEECIASRKKFTETINMAYDRTESKNNCEMSVREMQGGLIVTKGVTTIKADLDETVKYLRDLQKRGEYDGMFNSGKLLQQFQLSGVLYQKFNGIFPVSPRDFILLLTVEKIENGVMIHGKSTEFIQYQGDGKSVRGQVISAGFLIKNVGGGNIEITYLTYSDPAGKLPDMIKKKAGNMQSGVIMKIRDNLLKRFKQ